MKKRALPTLVALGLLTLIVMVSVSWAQSARRLHYSTLFNPQTVGRISGEVVRVEQVPSGNGADLCVQALLNTPKGALTAVLAPQSYMKTNGLTIAPRDRVELTGSFITIMGKPYVLVMEVKGDRSMKLRAADGRPAWAVGEDWHVRPTSSRSASESNS